MSTICLVKQSPASVGTPTATKIRIGCDSSGNLFSKDENGTVILYGAGLTGEQVQDIVGNLIQSSTNISVNYNDVGDILTLDISNTELLAYMGLSTTGILVRSASATVITRSIAVGSGLSVLNGDGISGNPTISMPNVGTAGTYGSASSVPVITTDAQGRVSGVTLATITPAAIGAQPVDGDLTALAALAGTGFVVRTAADTFTTRSIAVGSGLSISNGDGISGNPTISMPNVGTAGTYGSASSVPVITTDAQGRVSGVTLATITPAAIGAQPVDDDLTALAALAGTGFVVRTAANTFTTRSIAVGASLSISNGDGISGNPTISMPNVGTAGTYGSSSSVPVITTDAQGRVSGVTLATITPAAIGAQPVDDDLTALAALAGTGFVVRTAANTFTTRSIAVGASLSISNGDGISGNPTISMPNVGTAGTYGTSTDIPVITTDAQGRVTNVSTAVVNPGGAIFGSEFEDFSDLTQAQTTSTTFSSAASFTTASKPVARFRIAVFFNWSINVSNADARFRLMINGVQTGPELRVEASETANQSRWASGFIYFNNPSATTISIILQFAAETLGNTVTVFETRSEIWRVS